MAERHTDYRYGRIIDALLWTRKAGRDNKAGCVPATLIVPGKNGASDRHLG